MWCIPKKTQLIWPELLQMNYLVNCLQTIYSQHYSLDLSYEPEKKIENQTVPGELQHVQRTHSNLIRFSISEYTYNTYNAYVLQCVLRNIP